MTAVALGLPMTAPPSLPDVLRFRSEQQPDDTAYVFLRNGEIPGDDLTYRELDLAARARAAAVAELGVSSAVLLYPSGLEFIRALLGCMYARVAGAPVQVPTRARGLRRLRRIADDAGTTTVLTTAAVKRELEEHFGDQPELAGLTLVDTESLRPEAAAEWNGPAPEPDDIALLQYTSGSTGDPKGVIVTHANFRGNVVETDDLWPCGVDGAIVNWLPLFHDMGMLFGVVLPLWAGVPAYLMAPEAFVRRPVRWLEAIDRFRGTHSAAPSFAYELCVQAAAEGNLPERLDLSSWRVAVNGAEPVRPHTVRAFTDTFALQGFDPRAMCPGYGLAENTLKASGSRQDREPAVLRLLADALQEGRVVLVDATGAFEDNGPDVVPVVGCGSTIGATRIRIVAPDTRTACPPDRVGEIWVSGPCVAGGYRGRPEETRETFAARVAGEEDSGTWLRTGDLGFLHDDEVFVTGRLKDVIIRKGRNYYPQDIELSAESAAPGLRPNCAAAFSVDDGMTERLVVMVEVDGRVLRDTGEQGLRERVRDAVRDAHRLEVDEIMLIRRGSLPKTSSGKVQRRACRLRFLDGEFSTIAPAARRSL
ncbi:fatty acyl-AMP ligase [Streptomyces sp. NPDC048484]|uniref:fatty acyl-AMP ligase n=1 Tax=Streptomyces sp. NPDC048484 TaxID=3155146 RepID=UPI00343DE932